MIRKGIQLFRDETVINFGPCSRMSLADNVLVLIPLAPIIQYVLLNQNMMPFEDQLLFMGVTAAIIFSVVIAIPFVVQKYLPVYGLVPLGITLSYVYLSMPAFSRTFKWVSRPDLPLLAAILVILFSTLLLLYIKQRKLLHRMAFIFFMVSVIYTLYVIYILQEAEEASAYIQMSIPERDFSNFIPTGSMKKKPDIYLLTYDAYVGQETMQQYGIDNYDQETFLTNHGFKIYKDVYSVGSDSLNSMSRVLEMVGGGTLDKMLRISTAGNALVVDILKSQDYRTYGILTSHFIVNAANGWNYAYPENTNKIGYQSLLKGLKEGEFRFAIMEQLGFSRAEQLAKKKNILSAQTPFPKFMYTHSLLPGHSFNSSKCRPNEIERFKYKLQVANQEMKEDISTVLASNRDAIIIVNGDHGPYLTGDCSSSLKGYPIKKINQLYLQDRYGTFLAIRWPDENYKQYDDIRILQDTFEAVFKFTFGTNNVLRQRPNTRILKRGITEEGFVVDGKIMKGKDKGKPLFNPIPDSG